MHLYKKAVAIVAVSMMAAGSAIAAGGNADNGKKIYNEGKGTAPACISCHGPKGLGDDSMGTPRLVGQGYTFLVKQLNDFATDKRSDTTMYTMNTTAKAMSKQDRADVAAYLSSVKEALMPSDMKAVAALGHVVGKTHRGKALATYGDGKRGISACHSCHSHNGRGAFPMYPVIGGQRYVYLVSQLKNWRDGSRANDMMSQMQAVAKNMTDDDIYNVAAFLTAAPAGPAGSKTGGPSH